MAKYVLFKMENIYIFNFTVGFPSWICAVENTYAKQSKIAVISLLGSGSLGDAQRVFQAERSLKESIDRDETKVLCNTSHEQFIITSNFQLYCQIYLRLVYSHGLYKFVIFILVFFAFRYIFQL